MNNQEAMRLFDEAKQRFARADYVGALEILDALDEEFPRQRNVLLPKARCLAKLGMTEQAVAMCEFLIREFNDDKAKALRDTLKGPYGGITTPPVSFPQTPSAMSSQASSLTGMVGRLPDLSDLTGPVVRYKPVEEEKTSRWRDILLYGGVGLGALVVILVVVGLIGVAVSHSGSSEVAQRAAESPRAAPSGPFGVPLLDRYYAYRRRPPTPGHLAFWLLLVPFQGLPLFLAVSLYHKKRHDELWRDLLDTWMISFAVSLLATFCCCPGFIFGILLVKQRYGFEDIEVLTLIVFNVIFSVVFMGIEMALTGF